MNSTGKLWGFFLALGLCAFGLDSLIDFGLRHAPEFAPMNRAMAGKVNADVVINGSSRAMSHYDPALIEKMTGLTAFNLGRNGSQTDIQVAVLRAYLRHNKKPAYVIQNLDHFSFIATDTNTHRLYDPGMYLPHLREPEIYNAIWQADPRTWKWKYIPLYGYAVEDMRMEWVIGLRSLLTRRRSIGEANGFVPRDLEWGGDFDLFRSHFTNGVNIELTPRGVAAMDDLVALCRAEGIQLILVYSPEYRGMQQLIRNRREIFERFQKLADGPGVVLWDYSDSEICADHALFYNSQHLNRQGAEKFSEELAARLEVYARTNREPSRGKERSLALRRSESR